MSLSNQSIGFVGGGQMAEALVRGILSAGLSNPERMLVVEPEKNRTDFLRQTYGIGCVQTPEELCRQCSVIIAAIKPQLAAAVLSHYRPFVTSSHLILSIMAGVGLTTLAQILVAPVRLIRAMPNTPALVLAAATAFSLNDQATEEDRLVAQALFSAVGTCIEVPEQLLDAVTGLSGSGPGYVFAFIEALIDGGVSAGLPRTTAEQLALQTVYGSARLAQETGEHPAVLKGKVTSPAGTTIRGLQVLEEGALRGLVMKAVVEATTRSKELGA